MDPLSIGAQLFAAAAIPFGMAILLGDVHCDNDHTKACCQSEAAFRLQQGQQQLPLCEDVLQMVHLKHAPTDGGAAA